MNPTIPLLSCVALICATGCSKKEVLTFYSYECYSNGIMTTAGWRVIGAPFSLQWITNIESQFPTNHTVIFKQINQINK